MIEAIQLPALNVITYTVPFLVALIVIVFIHELGHFLVARWCGVRVESFSVGFGKEIFGWHDKHGTRWKFCWLPLGGYVKFEGDANVASMPGAAKSLSSTNFHNKPVWQRAAVVAAGPIANFLLAIFIFAGMFMVFGEALSPPRVDEVTTGSAAASAGLQPGDHIVRIDDQKIESFQQLREVIYLGGGALVRAEIERGTSHFVVSITPKIEEVSDNFGGKVRVGLLGVKHDGTKDTVVYKKYGPVDAISKGVERTWFVVSTTMKYIGKLFVGEESSKQIGGAISIAKGAGDAAGAGFPAFVSFLAFISISIGLINLFPIPMLDGGHLVFYAIEALRGKPLGAQAQEWGARIGISLVMLMLVVGTLNDLVRLVTVHLGAE